MKPSIELVDSAEVKTQYKFREHAIALSHFQIDEAEHRLALVPRQRFVELIYNFPRSSLGGKARHSEFEKVSSLILDTSSLIRFLFKAISSNNVLAEQDDYFVFILPSIRRNRSNKAWIKYTQNIVSPGLEYLQGKTLKPEQRVSFFSKDHFRVELDESKFSWQFQDSNNKVLLNLPLKFSLKQFCQFSYIFLRNPALANGSISLPGLLLPEERSLELPEVTTDLPPGVRDYLARTNEAKGLVNC